jgi:hypothetical protein
MPAPRVLEHTKRIALGIGFYIKAGGQDAYLILDDCFEFAIGHRGR